MDTEDSESLANIIDMHCIDLLRSVRTEKQSVAWMKIAFNLLETCSKDLRRPRMFAAHNGFGCAIYTLEHPEALILPKNDSRSPPPIWIGGETIPYGDKFQSKTRPWTAKDSRRLVKENERKRAELLSAEKLRKKSHIVRKGK